jgi:hypothetical protein
MVAFGKDVNLWSWSHVQVDARILKGTVLEGNDIDAAVEFILTEVLEQPSTGKVDERLAKELISGSGLRLGQQTSAVGNEKRSAEGMNLKSHPYARDQNPFGIMGDMFNVAGSSVDDAQPLIDMDGLQGLRSDKAAEGSKLPVPESLPIDIPVGAPRMNDVQESLSYENPLKSPCKKLLLSEEVYCFVAVQRSEKFDELSC